MLFSVHAGSAAPRRAHETGGNRIVEDRPIAAELTSFAYPDPHLANRFAKVVAASAAPGFGEFRGGRLLPNRSAGVRGLDGVVPTVQRNIDIAVFPELTLWTGAGYSSDVCSDPYPMCGNVCGISLIVENISSSPAQVAVYLDAGINRRAWTTLATFSATTFGYTSQFVYQVYQPWLRVRVRLDGVPDQSARMGVYTCHALAYP